MVQSMTGYGRCEGIHADRTYVVEVRSVNSKYCDVAVKVPRSLLPIEPLLKKEIQQRFSRGRFDVAVTSNGVGDQVRHLTFDDTLARQYYEVLRSLKDEFHLKGDIDLGIMAGFKDILTVADIEEEQSRAVRLIRRLLRDALDSLERMRKEEGRALCIDLKKRLKVIDREQERIRRRIPKATNQYYKRLREKVSLLPEVRGIEDFRLMHEIALLVEKTDVTEELARFKSHQGQFLKFIGSEGAVGRRLDFLLQEMNREINTISSKANDAYVSMRVVNIKNELEKIREQVQNIE